MVSWIDYFNNLRKVERKLLIFLTLILLISVFLRFYNLENLLYWMFDEERDAFVVKRILVDKHPTLIGGSVPGVFYLAPGYFYISALFYFFSQGNPLGLGFVASVLGVLSVLFLFFVAKDMFGRKVAVISTIIYTASYLVIGYNRTWWPLVFAPLVSIVSYYCLFQAITFKKIWFAIPLSLALIVGAQSDPSNFSLIILTVIFWIIYKLPFKDKRVIFAIFLFFFSHLPLVLFDLRHDFFNAKLILKLLFFESSSGNFQILQAIKELVIFPQTFTRFLFVSFSPDWSFQIVPHEFYLEKKFREMPVIIFFFSIFLFLWFIKKFIYSVFTKKDFGIKVVGAHILIAAVGVVLYNAVFPGYTHEWFLQVLFPGFAIILGIFLSQLLNRKYTLYVIWAGLGIYLFIGIVVILNARNSYSFGLKSQAVKWVLSQINGKPFSLDSPSTSFSYGGYRYLFYLYGHEPVKSYMDPVFIDWMYPKESIARDHPDIVVVMMNPDLYYQPFYFERYNIYRSKTIARKQFGFVEVLIIDNKDRWVDW